MRILITGVYGFIGSAFAKLVLEETDWQAVGLGRLGEKKNVQRLGDLVTNHPRLSLITGDLIDPGVISGICEDIDYVVHFSAKTFVDHSIRDPQPFIASNIGGTYNLLEQARKYFGVVHPSGGNGIKKYIQVSTDEVYGSILEGAYKEDAPLNPTNPYAATKAAGDMLALSYFNTYKMPIVVTRTENNYGAFQSRQKVVPTFVRKLMAGEPLPIYGDGKHIRQWLHVEDHCRAILLLLEKGVSGHIYHVAGNQELMNIELAEIISRAYGVPLNVQYMNDMGIRPGHDRRYALNSDKIRELGWVPRWTLEDGLKATVDWYRTHEDWVK